MVKSPKPGRVKTRLGRGIGTVPATWWYRHQSFKTIKDLVDPRWTTVLAVAPDRLSPFWDPWPAGPQRIAQGNGDLGDRMGRIFNHFAPDPTLIIGSDIPDISKHEIARAFRTLNAGHGVIGPATDGGYWAIGLRGRVARQKGLFQDIRWSSEHALEDTKRSIHLARFIHLSTLTDVDTASDLAGHKK